MRVRQREHRADHRESLAAAWGLVMEFNNRDVKFRDVSHWWQGWLAAAIHSEEQRLSSPIPAISIKR